MIDSNMTKERAKLQQAIAGCALFPSGSQLSLGGQTMTAAQLMQAFQRALTAMGAVVTTKNAWETALATQVAERQTADGLYKSLKMFAVAQWGKSSPQVTGFGFSVATRKAMTAEEKALSAAKAKRTRAVRGVTGKVARKQVTVAGSPGLQLVAADGTPIPGVTQGPVSPAGAKPSVGAAPVAPTTGK